MASYVFDGEDGFALQAMQGNQSSTHGEGEVSWFFSRCGGNLEYILEGQREWPFKTRICSATSGLQSSYDRNLRISTMFGRKIRMLLELNRETLCPFLVATGILGFLSICKKSQVS